MIANRGEVAIRIARAAAEAGIPTVAIFAEDDAAALHVRRADEARALRGRGASAYLDGDQIVRLARDAACEALHPGYGFLSESADFAQRCEQAGLVFVGQAPDSLARFGEKARTRELAAGLGVPIPAGTSGATTLVQARAFLDDLRPGAAIMTKAIHGGGGRGLRLVERSADLEDAYARAVSEAQAAFGDGAVYVERIVPNARHIEVQVAGDGSGRVAHLWERECTLQRRHQKLVEIAPAPNLEASLRAALIDARCVWRQRSRCAAWRRASFWSMRPAVRSHSSKRTRDCKSSAR